MTQDEGKLSSGALRRPLPVAFAVCATLAILASAHLGNPLTAAAASLVLVVAWRSGARPAFVVGASAMVALMAYGHAHAPRHFHLAPAALETTALFLCCAALPKLAARAGRRRQHDASDDAARPAVEPIVRPARRETTASEALVHLEAIRRFLGDARHSLGVDDLLFWRLAPTGELQIQSTASGLTTAAELESSPPVHTMVAWAASQGLPIVNEPTDGFLLLMVPVDSQEQPLGALAAYIRARPLGEPDDVRDALRVVADQFGVLLRMLDEGREARRFHERTAGLIDACRRINTTQDLAAAGRAICLSALEVSAASRALCVYWDDDREEGRVCGVSPGHPVTIDSLVDATSLIGTACRERQRFVLREEYRMAPGLTMLADGEPRRQVGSLAVVPLTKRQRVLGAIVVEGGAPGQLTNAEIRALELLAQGATPALENALRFEEVHGRLARVQVHALTDSLTGLANRRAFDERLAQMLEESDRFGHPTALVLLDVDHFKLVNDRLGHAAGDAALTALAAAVQRKVRSVDICARYGGEELAVLMPQTPLQAASDAAERLRRAVEDLEVEVAGESLKLTASFGVASYPESCQGRDDLFPSADGALYTAKSGGRNCIRSAAKSEPAQAV